MRKKLYMIVTNDEYELPLSCEEYEKEQVAEILGIKESMVIKYCCIGFPKKLKNKAVVVGEKKGNFNIKIYQKKYALEHDRTEYYREYRRNHKETQKIWREKHPNYRKQKYMEGKLKLCAK